MPATISEGATGPEVREAQYLLARFRALTPSDIDGTFGPVTDKGVREFQAEQGLAVDGVIGPLTWAALQSQFSIPPTLSMGSSGPIVGRLQAILNDIGPQMTPPAGPIAVDNDFGPATRAMVEGFQHWGGVGADGVVGLQTWAVSMHAAGQELVDVVGL
ncbi:MAG: peptidoglycan-binding protein [Actinomycetota bacterium]|nr:peptidoglycan-binding protein [Actinomycetota bacterium]